MKKTYSQETLGKIALVTEALAVSLTGLIIRFLGPSFTLLQQVSLRIFAALLLSILVWGRSFRWQKLKELTKKEWALIIVRSICFYLLGVAIYSWAILQTKYTNVSLIQRFPSTAILGVLLLKEKLTKEKLFWIFAGIVGVVIVIGENPTNLFVWGSGEMYALISVIFFSLSYVLRKFHSSILNDIEITQLMFFFSFCIIASLSLLLREPFTLVSLTNPSVFFTLVAAGVINVAIVGGINYGYKRVEAIIANNISLLKVVFTALFSILFLHEQFSGQSIIGGIIIVFAVIQMNRLEGKKTENPS